MEIERVLEGFSTFVYRVKQKGSIYYLRVLPEPGNRFQSEVLAHNLLRNRGVKAPRVIHYEVCNELISLSIMILEEIKGVSIEDQIPSTHLQDILYEAGKDLAVLNQIPVVNYGFINQYDDEQLKASHLSFKDYYEPLLSHDLSLLGEYGLFKTDIDHISNLLLTSLDRLSNQVSYLVHGDFDFSHIFHHDGHYTGMIDLGEIMGNHPLYDLGHFKIHDGQVCPLLGFESLLKGYQEVQPLNTDDLYDIELLALLVGVRRLGMIYGRNYIRYSSFLVQKIKEQLEIIKGV